MLRRVLVLAPLIGCASDPAAIPAPTSAATGELAAWTMAAPQLPTARANHCSAVIDDWMIVIGGNRKEGTGFVKTDEIHGLQIHADGTFGTWLLLGRTPSPVSECSATSDGRTLYVIDGLYDRETDARQVWSAELDRAGTLGALTSLGRLPADTIAISSEATVRAGELLLMDTRLPNEGDSTVTLRTPLVAPLAWTTDDWHIGFRAQSQYAFTADTAFVLGGYKGDAGNPVSAETFAAAIGDAGAIGASHATAALPTPTAFGEAVAVDDWVFVVGGRSQALGGTNGSMTAVAAHVEADGSLGAWKTVAALPMLRTNHELAVVGDYLVLTGGAGTGPGDTTVLTARVRYPIAH
ncbi:MAG: kelch repeat-containing protein [Polyangiales bacterium]